MSDKTLVGQYIRGRYQLQEVIGTGGMGIVFKAYDHHSYRECAVKLLKSTVTKETTYQRFEEEIRLITKLTSPHIVQVYDAGVSENKRRFVVMELLHGFPLSKILAQETQLDAERGLHIALGICLALEAAHQSGVIHRDLKPANIFVNPSSDGDLIKILDFGIAKDLSRDISLNLTNTGMLVGTPTYMSPESFNDHPEITVKVDLYAVGLLLYRMITGRIPFYPNHPELPKAIKSMPIPIQVCWLHLNTVPALIESIPEEVALFIAQLLEKDPSKRPQSATNTIRIIHHLLHTYYPKNHELSHTQILPKTLFADVTNSLDISIPSDMSDPRDPQAVSEDSSLYSIHQKKTNALDDRILQKVSKNVSAIESTTKLNNLSLKSIESQTVALNPEKIKELHAELEAYMQTQGINVIANKKTASIKRSSDHDESIDTEFFLNPRIRRSRPYIKKLLILLGILALVCYYLWIQIQ